MVDSTASCPRTLGDHTDSSYDYVYCRRFIDLWHDYQLRNVLPGRARILAMTAVLLGGEDGKGTNVNCVEEDKADMGGVSICVRFHI